MTLPKNCRVEIHVVGYLYFLPAWSKVNLHLLKYWHGANVGALHNRLDQSRGFLKDFVSSCFQKAKCQPKFYLEIEDRALSTLGYITCLLL